MPFCKKGEGSSRWRTKDSSFVKVCFQLPDDDGIDSVRYKVAEKPWISLTDAPYHNKRVKNLSKITARERAWRMVCRRQSLSVLNLVCREAIP